MNSQAKVKRQQLNPETFHELIIDSIQDIKGKNIVKLDLRHLDEAPADFFIICEGDSNTQVKAISDHINKRVNIEASLLPNHMEGMRNALWVCIDYFTTVVHVFYRETRSYYELEELWSDAHVTEYQTL